MNGRAAERPSGSKTTKATADYNDARTSIHISIVKLICSSDNRSHPPASPCSNGTRATIAEQPIEFHARWSGSAGQVVKMMSRNAGTG